MTWQHGRPWPHPQRPSGVCVNEFGLLAGTVALDVPPEAIPPGMRRATREEVQASVVVRHWSGIPGYESEAGCLTALWHIEESAS